MNVKEIKVNDPAHREGLKKEIIQFPPPPSRVGHLRAAVKGFVQKLFVVWKK